MSPEKDKIFFTATSMSSNGDISGTLDDDGNISKMETTYDIKYISPIN